jgi:gluconolactonase
MNPTRLISILGVIVCMSTVAEGSDLLADGAQVRKLCGGFRFTEGPAADTAGNVYFTDIPNNRIHIWCASGELKTFREDSGGANGLYFDKAGNLLVCEGGGRRLVSIGPDGNLIVLADGFEGKRFNSLNDLWIDAQGGVYCTDPRYSGRRDNMEQNGEHVYYVSPNHRKVTCVIKDLVRPNGVIGTPDGKTLYVADHGGKKTFRYAIQASGTLADKTLLMPEGSDGMTLDERGNIYLTTSVVAIYSPAGVFIDEIQVRERPSNVCFGGPQRKTLFITARSSLYAIDMRVRGK